MKRLCDCLLVEWRSHRISWVLWRFHGNLCLNRIYWEYHGNILPKFCPNQMWRFYNQVPGWWVFPCFFLIGSTKSCFCFAGGAAWTTFKLETCSGLEVFVSLIAIDLQGKSAKAVKQSLAVQIGVPRFRQRLFREDSSDQIPDGEVFISTSVFLRCLCQPGFLCGTESVQPPGQLTKTSVWHTWHGITCGPPKIENGCTRYRNWEVATIRHGGWYLDSQR